MPELQVRIYIPGKGFFSRLFLYRRGPAFVGDLSPRPLRNR